MNRSWTCTGLTDGRPKPAGTPGPVLRCITHYGLPSEIPDQDYQTCFSIASSFSFHLILLIRLIFSSRRSVIEWGHFCYVSPDLTDDTAP